MLKRLLYWAFKDELRTIARHVAQEKKFKRSRGTKAHSKPWVKECLGLKVGQCYVVDNPKMVTHRRGGRYCQDHCSPIHKVSGKKRYSQMTYEGKCIITRTV